MVNDTHLAVVFNTSIYRVKQPYLYVPTLVPTLTYEDEIEIQCTDPTGAADTVKVYVCSGSSSIPLITAVVNMPLSELPLDQGS